MSNLPYCRFRNTLADLQDCQEALWDTIEDGEEKRARKRLIEVCRQIVEEAEDLTDDE